MKKVLFFCTSLLFAIGTFLINPAKSQTCPSWGPYLEGRNMENSGELWYSEVMVDKTCIKENTYYSTQGFALGPRGGYAGIQYHLDKDGKEVYKNIFSMWDLQESKVPQCITEYTAPNTNVRSFGGEGTGLHTNNPMPWKTDVWYATVLRRWSLGDGKTRIGFFMYDFELSEWKHYVTIITPEDNAKFVDSKLPAFVENWNADASKATRCGYFRNFWSMDSEGKWSKPTQYVALAGDPGSWSAETAFDNTAIKVTSCGTTPAPAGGVINFESITQKGDKPSTALPIAITAVWPSYDYSNNLVTVKWESAANTSPQLSYKVSLYSEESWGKGYTPIAEVKGVRPDQRSASISLPSNFGSGKYYVSVVLEDIFNQTSNFGYNDITLLIPPIDPNAYYRIKCVGSAMYVTPVNYSKASGAKMVQYPYNENQAQQWKIEKTGNNYVIVNRASGLAIDIPSANITNGTTLIQYKKHGKNNQQWVLKPYKANKILIGTALSDMKSMDNPGHSKRSGTPINIWDQDMNGVAGENHQWILEKVTTSNVANSSENSKDNEISTSVVYPNPVKQGEILTITLPENADDYQLLIVNTEGVVVKSQNSVTGKVLISTSNMKRGSYFYKASNKNVNISGKFIIQ